MRRAWLLAVLLFVAALAPAAARPDYSRPLGGDALVVYRLAWVDPGRYLRSGAVIVDGDHLASEAPGDRAAVARAYRALQAKYRVGAVVNLRDECAEDRAVASELGMRYLHLPIPDGMAPSPTQVLAFFDFLAAAQQRQQVVLWHCAGGIGRTGVLAAMLRLQQGWSTREAATEMFQMGLNYAQAEEHLPALNAFAAAMGRPGYFPADWRGARSAPHDYRQAVSRLPRLR